ncbi:unnamed protein product [Penicillium pancosmium]
MAAAIDHLPSEKTASDLETVNATVPPLATDATAKILEPLLFLLAARRGVRADPTFESMNIPDDRIITSIGNSGLEILNTASVFNRITAALAWFAEGRIIVLFGILNFILDYSRSLRLELTGILVTRTYLYGLKFGFMMISATWLVGIAAKKYTRKRLAGATPPQFDPTSYQYRFVQAMDQRRLRYRRVVTNSFKQMEKIWVRNLHVKERFCIEGLEDPESSWVYDINVRFWKNGNISVGFASSEGDMGVKTFPGVVLAQNVGLGGRGQA